MAEIIDLAHLVDWILTLYRNSTPVPVKGNQDKLAPTPAPENKESRLVPLLLAALGSFFHTYIHNGISSGIDNQQGLFTSKYSVSP
jgi:hypothetical protein